MRGLVASGLAAQKTDQSVQARGVAAEQRQGRPGTSQADRPGQAAGPGTYVQAERVLPQKDVLDEGYLWFARDSALLIHECKCTQQLRGSCVAGFLALYG